MKTQLYPFFAECLANAKIEFITEHIFAKSIKRKWQTDFYFERGNIKLALEIEGGAFTGGRHTRGTGFMTDMEKYNHYAVFGIALLRFTPTQIQKHPVSISVIIEQILSGGNATQLLIEFYNTIKNKGKKS